MRCEIINVLDNWVVVEVRSQKLLYRRLLPRDVVKTSRKGPANLPAEWIRMGIDIGDVLIDEVLGALGLKIESEDLMFEARSNSLWFAEDYIQNPATVGKVLKKLGVDVDPAVFVNAIFLSRRKQ